MAAVAIATVPANDSDRRRAAGMPHELARMFANGVVGVVRGSIAYGPTWANDRFLAMSGYDRSDIEGCGLDWDAMTPDEWAAEDSARLAAARVVGYSETYEKEFWRKDGSRWPVIVGFTIDSADSDLVTVFVIDLTASKRAETARRDVDRLYARFFEVSNVAFWTADAAGRVAFVSRTTADRLGTDAELDSAEAQAALIHPDDRAFAVATWTRSMAEGTAYDIEVRARGMDGAPYRWTRLQAFPDHADGRIVGWYGTSDDVHERRAATEALIESEARFKTLADDIPVMVWLTDARGRSTYQSKGWYELTGQTEAEAVDRGWMKTIHPDDVGGLAPVSEFFQRRQPFDLDFRVRAHDGSYRWLHSAGRARLDSAGELIGYAGSLTDIHARKVAEQALSAMQQRLSRALDGTGVGVWEWDAATDTVMISGSALHISGFRDTDVDYIPIDYHRMVHRDDTERFFKAMADYVAGHTTEFAVEMRIRTKDGGWVWVLDRGTALERNAEGRALRMVGTLTNIEDAKRAEAELRWTVEHDALTGLANRTRFNTRLDEALLAAGDGNCVALALLDIDDFKAVNDLLGHAAGDALLVVLAKRLRDFAYPHETVARLGGDEFTVLIPDCRDGPSVLARLENLRTQLAQPFVHDGRTLTCRSSIGVTLAPYHGRDASALLKNADIAMYSSKGLRRGAVTMFEPALGAQVRRDAAALGSLREALDAGRVKPCYQPVVRIVSGAVIGCEALAHIVSPAGAIAPLDASFAGDDADLAVRLGDSMLDAVLGDLRDWRAAGLVTGRVGINVSSAELRRGDYAERLLARLAHFGLPPNLLRVEVVETVLLGRGADRSAAALAALSTAGVCITLDAFGTGYASLTHLTRLTLGAIKIDRSFVQAVTTSGGLAIVSAITGLGASLGLAVIADGIADAAQADALAGLGCAFGQGDVFHRALRPHDAAAVFACRHAQPLGAFGATA